MHPISGMPESGVTLQALCVRHPRHGDLRAAYAAIGLASVAIQDGAPGIVARLNTPRGTVILDSKGI